MKLRRGLWAALAATLMAAVWVATIDDEAGIDAPARRGRPVAERVDAVAAIATPAASASRPAAWPAPPITAARAAWAALDPRAAQAWSAPAAAPAAREPVLVGPPELVMPALPYTLIGRIDDGSQPMALIAGAQRTHSARVGDVLDGDWRVDVIGPQGVALTWLPGHRTTRLAMRAP